MKTCSSVWHLISNIIKADANYIVAPAKGQEKKIEEQLTGHLEVVIYFFLKKNKKKKNASYMDKDF